LSFTGNGSRAEIKGVDKGVLPGDQSFGGRLFWICDRAWLRLAQG
jgi:hypothetical protein